MRAPPSLSGGSQLRMMPFGPVARARTFSGCGGRAALVAPRATFENAPVVPGALIAATR